ncbi:MAG: thioredoxin domain-containing protein [Candidatus Peregrinibacteria bacterium]|nr:thioredoxin domain-containing protein [Candidatus Peregrinibacteria bacterium]
MKKNVLKNIGLGIISLLLIGGVAFEVKMMMKPGPYDEFTRCLSDKGAKFYGAFWCPHCQRQKALFGKSAPLLPYVECSTPDAKGLLPICQEKKIEGFPTWIFADNTRLTGEIELQKLSEKTSCALPQ